MKNRFPAGLIVADPSEKYATKYRFWQGCPTVLCTPKGRMYAGWYSGGTKEPAPDQYNVLVRSDDEGMNWSDPVLVVDSIPEKKIRAIDIQLWLDPLNRMWLFWTTRDDNFKNNDPEHLKTWAIVCDDPEADDLQWSAPRIIAPGFLRCQPTVLSDGRYLLCAYDWTSERYSYSESADQGETWTRKQGGRKLGAFFDETMILERNDGSLWMLARSNQKCLVESVSTDGGATWTDGSPSTIVSPSTRFFLKRLASGNVLLVRNDHPDKRCRMTATLSDDDGKTWKYSLLLDPMMDVSYPDVAIFPDGSIFIMHDHNRVGFKEIVTSRITEEDIMAGELVNRGSYIKNIISKAPAQPYDSAVYEKQVEREANWKDELIKAKGDC